ncbi:hypothetical protein KR067_011271, partial [Drosophila pandora]
SYELVVNRRGGHNLIYKGHMYTLERKYRFSLNWVCSKNSNTALRCPARCVTDSNNSRRISLGHRPHNHPVATLKVHKSRRKTNEMR